MKEINYKISTEWNDKDLGDYKNYHPKEKKKSSFIFKFFIFSIILFLISLGVVFYSYNSNFSSFDEKKIIIDLNSPSSVSSGEKAKINLSILNSNLIAITNSYLAVSYDSGENFNGNKNLITNKIPVGDILPNSNINKDISFSVYGAETSSKNIELIFYYKLAGNNGEFAKKINPVNILISTSPVSLNVQSLDKVKIDQNLEFTLKVKNNTSKDIQNLLISTRGVNNFQYLFSDTDTEDNNPTFKIEDLKANSFKTIKFTGKFLAGGDLQNTFTFFAGISEKDNKNISTSTNNLGNFDNFNLNIENIYSKVEKKIEIDNNYLSLYLEKDNNNFENEIGRRKSLSLFFKYKNNTEFPIDNVVFEANLDPKIIDKENLVAEKGVYEQESGKIFWNKNTSEEFAKIPAGGEGELKISIKLLDLKTDDILGLKIYGKGERNYEKNVSNEQNVLIDSKWYIVE